MDNINDVVITPDMEAIFRLIDKYNILEEHYLGAISCPCSLTFRGKSMTIEYLNGYVPHEDFAIQQSEFGNYEVYDIGTVFTAFFELYESIVKNHLLDDKDFPSKIENSYNILKILIELAKDNSSEMNDYVDMFNASADGDFKLFDNMGKSISTRCDVLVNKFKTALDNKEFDAFLRNNINYIYNCSNVYQICCSIIDYIFKYSEGSCDKRNNWHYKKISLRRCKNCGKFFLADSQNRKYCNNIIDGKTCAEQAEAKRKKDYVRKTPTNTDKLERKIMGRLNNYCNTMRDKDDSTEYDRRCKIYDLWKALRDIKRNHGDYHSWLENCEKEIDKKNSNIKYEDFYKWLLTERSKYGVSKKKL